VIFEIIAWNDDELQLMTTLNCGQSASALPRMDLRIFPGVLCGRLVVEVASSARMPAMANAYLNVWMKGELPKSWCLPRGPAFKKNLLHEAQQDLAAGLSNVAWGQTLIAAGESGTRCPRLLALAGEDGKVLVCLGQAGYQPVLESPLGDAHILPFREARAELNKTARPHIYNKAALMRAIVDTRGPPRGEEIDVREEKACWKQLNAVLNTADETGFMMRMIQGPSTDTLMRLASLNCLIMVFKGGDLEDEELLKADPLVSYCVLPPKIDHIVYMLGDVLWGGRGPIPGQDGHSYRISLRAMSHPSVWFMTPAPITGLLRFWEEPTFDDKLRARVSPN